MPTPVKILVVDDEINFTKALEIFLTKAGYTVHVANSGQEAIDLIHEYRYDLVLLDLNMPGIDGIKVAEALKAMRQVEDVIVITGHKEEYEEKLKALNIQNIMEKPIGRNELLEKIQSIIAPIIAEPLPCSVTTGIPTAKLLFIDSEIVYDNLFAPYFREINRQGKAKYELLFAEDKAKAISMAILGRPDVILLNTNMIMMYQELQKEIDRIVAIPKEVIVHGIELYGKRAEDLGLDRRKVTAIEAGVYEMIYPKKLEEAVRAIAFRHGLVDGKKYS